MWMSKKTGFHKSQDPRMQAAMLGKSVNYDINCALFREVQRFVMSTNRFSMTTV